ncbi:expressed protein [Chlorella variabilis]|uniref:Expressed protein n=1 Tax=Chlorella variabilis TaxID=554065 RepID=E1ZEZ0_CHLVA|nr:expressed protein [Chlorella variabilis]EFN55745.1 expressed protein [Chlorella variabilis]|eukprot:XP_005847847.1 expressed protein [Chlorella variabilis]
MQPAALSKAQRLASNKASDLDLLLPELECLRCCAPPAAHIAFPHVPDRDVPGAALQGGLAGTRRRLGGGGGRRAAMPLRAAAASEEAADLGSLFRDALSSPVVKKAAAPPAPAPAPAAALPDAAAPASGVTVDPVPGTEILQGAPAPQPPPAPSQGMDFVLEQLQQKPPGYGDSGAAAAKAAKAAAAPLADTLGEGLASAGKGLGEAGAAASKGLTSAADSVGDVLGGAAGALTGAAAGAADAAAAASQATDAFGSVLSGAAGGLSGAAGGLSGAAGGAASSVQQLLDGAAAELSSEAAALQASYESLVGGLTSTLGGVTSAVSSTVGGQVAAVADQLSGAVDAAAAALPPGAGDVLLAAGGAAAGALRQLSGLDPAAAAAAAGLGLGLPAALAWSAAYGGFAGALDPEEALEVLQTEAAVLVDVRTEQQRVERGVAELRRGALGKGAAVPPVQLLPSVAKRLRDPAGVALEIQALEVAALAKVRPRSTKVIVMDDKGEGAKRVARALRAAGVRRPYVLAGGFRAWQEAGLGVRSTASEYEASPLDVAEDVAGTVAEQAASQLSPLREPKNAAVAAAALGGLGYVAANFHTTLQFLGVLGLELTLVNRALSYGSVEEALEDVRGLAGSAASLAALPAKAAEALGRAGRGVAAAAQQAAGDSKV